MLLPMMLIEFFCRTKEALQLYQMSCLYNKDNSMGIDLEIFENNCHEANYVANFVNPLTFSPDLMHVQFDEFLNMLRPTKSQFFVSSKMRKRKNNKIRCLSLKEKC